MKKKKKNFNCMKLICWIIIPFAIFGMIVLDGLGIYTINSGRLIIICACFFVVLMPFFKEINIKDFSFKKGNDDK